VIFPAVLADNRLVLAGLLAAAETDMHRFGSHPNHENRPLHEGSRLRASRATAGKDFFEFLVTYPPHKEALFWVGGNHRTRWIE